MTNATDWQGAVGDVWADEWQRTDRAFAELTNRLDAAIVAAAPDGPFSALDLGCGAGATALALARARPDAVVLGVDLSPALTASARERGVDLANLTFETGDAVSIAEARGPFDLIVSRHGVMFFADPDAAFAALHRATRPGGILVFTCFARPEDNAFAGPLATALGLPTPRAGDAPGPFAFADPAYVADLLAATGWHVARPEQIDFRYRVGAGAAPLDDAVGFLSRIGPAAAAMRNADNARRAEVRAGLRAFLADHATQNAVDLPASAWLWSARA